MTVAAAVQQVPTLLLATFESMTVLTTESTIHVYSSQQTDGNSLYRCGVHRPSSRVWENHGMVACWAVLVTRRRY